MRAITAPSDVHSIQSCVKRFVSDLLQFDGILWRVPLFPHPNKRERNKVAPFGMYIYSELTIMTTTNYTFLRCSEVYNKY